MSRKHTVSVNIGRRRSTIRSNDRPNLSFSMNFNKESDRLQSFENWPVAFLSPSRMASAGFYYIYLNDTVRCPFCGVEVGCWVEGDDPIADHRMWSPNCKFVKNLPCGNIPLDASGETDGTVDDYDTCGCYGIEIRHSTSANNLSSTSNELPSLENLNIQVNRSPDYPIYGTYDRRMKTYRDWPKSMKLKDEQLSEAGFFYLGRGDQVMCFQCGLGVKDWEDNDDPWIVHARFSPKCAYLLLVKGKKFIQDIQGEVLQQSPGASNDTSEETTLINDLNTQKNIVSDPQSSDSRNDSHTSETKSEVSKIPPAKSESNSETNNLCKVCYAEEKGAAFLPCGHIVACVKCTSSLRLCAICRVPFTATVRVYLS